MKNKTIKFVIFFSFFFNFSFSQDYKDTLSLKNAMILKDLSPGNELLRFHEKYTAGVFMVVGGSALMSIGAFSDQQADDKKVYSVIGGLVNLAGAFFIVSSHKHIKYAGLLLNENGIGIKVPIR
jgi:hypothetical protein